MPPRVRVIAILLLPLLAACSRQDPPNPRTQPQARIEAPAAAAPAAAGAEASARAFERQVLEPPPPPRLALPVPAPSRSPEPPPNTAVNPEARAAIPPPKPPPLPTQPPAPPSAPPSAPPPAVATAPPAEARLVRRVDPDFPREALQARVDRGLVRARITIDAAGEVTRVDVLDARPRRVFDRAVVRALSQWKFSPGDDGRIVDTEIAFNR